QWLEAAVGPRVAPKLTWLRRRAGSPTNQAADRRFGRRVIGDDPMELARERQSGCRRLFAGQNQNQRIVRLLRAPVERLVILHDLPGTDSGFPNEQDKGI